MGATDEGRGEEPALVRKLRERQERVAAARAFITGAIRYDIPVRPV